MQTASLLCGSTSVCESGAKGLGKPQNCLGRRAIYTPGGVHRCGNGPGGLEAANGVRALLERALSSCPEPRSFTVLGPSLAYSEPFGEGVGGEDAPFFGFALGKRRE